jgi:hypothetical protein
LREVVANNPILMESNDNAQGFIFFLCFIEGFFFRVCLEAFASMVVFFLLSKMDLQNNATRVFEGPYKPLKV